jgi:hypothetical protein
VEALLDYGKIEGKVDLFGERHKILSECCRSTAFIALIPEKTFTGFGFSLRLCGQTAVLVNF